MTAGDPIFCMGSSFIYISKQNSPEGVVYRGGGIHPPPQQGLTFKNIARVSRVKNKELKTTFSLISRKVIIQLLSYQAYLHAKNSNQKIMMDMQRTALKLAGLYSIILFS